MGEPVGCMPPNDLQLNLLSDPQCACNAVLRQCERPAESRQSRDCAVLRDCPIQGRMLTTSAEPKTMVAALS